jgi:zinc transporter 1/2/3
VRQLYDPASQTAQLVSGVLDTVSAGILLYTALVELLAREFLFSGEVRGMRGGEVGWMVGWVLAGAAAMASLGKWA